MIDVIIPVYADYQVTKSCLESVFKSSNHQPYELIVIYDFGPDKNLEAYLEDLAAQQKITLLKNEKNLGFVATVNRGMQCHPDRDIILLNSDTLVANNWLDRLYACANSDKTISTVTPFSNNAEICSFPDFCRDNALWGDYSVEQIDQLFAASIEPAALDVPTGVGFCMYITRPSLDDVGLFDEETYGRGYGEENDFCRRADKKGWRNTHCTNLFVFHQGGVSFSDEKAERVQHAMQVLDRLYPDYHQLVHDFIQQDPAKAYRIQALIELHRQSDRQHSLMITHSLGGGTSKHVMELVDYLEEDISALWLQPFDEGMYSLRFGLTEGCDELIFDANTELQQLTDLLHYIGLDYIHVHHTKGLDKQIEFLLKELDCPYDVSLHDYYFINGNPTLADDSGRFCPDPETRDQLCARHSAVPLEFSATEWRTKTEALLKQARYVLAPSEYTKALFKAYFPAIELKSVAHPDYEQDAPYPSVIMPPKAKELRIAIIGALGLEKGADILEQVARLSHAKGLPYRFHLIGYAYRELSPEVSQHGSYSDNDLAGILTEFDPHLVWFPCQWPETYSYTLSACLRQGLPVLAPDFGAFTERLHGRPLSWLARFDIDPEGWLAAISDIYNNMDNSLSADAQPWETQQVVSKFYKETYLLTDTSAGRSSAEFKLDKIQVLLASKEEQIAKIGRKEQFLRVLIIMRSWPVLRHCLRLVPFSLQRKIKRLLSSRSIHDIIQ